MSTVEKKAREMASQWNRDWEDSKGWQEFLGKAEEALSRLSEEQAEAQAVRSRRALQNLHEYSFQRRRETPVGTVTVTNRKSKESYEVTRNSCTCQDFKIRCEPLQINCKHGEMVRLTPFGKNW